MNQTVKKIWNVVSTVLVALVVLIAVFLMGSRLLGYRVFSVLSGSMEPKYSTGDLIYVDEVDPSQIKVGDAITFILNEDLLVATHEVIGIDAEKQHFFTKGIANEDADKDPVHFNNLIGKPVFSLPKLGYVSNWIQNPPGTYVTIAAGVALVALVFLPDLLRGKKKKEAPQGDADKDKELEQLRAELAAAKQQLEQAQPAEQETAAE